VIQVPECTKIYPLEGKIAAIDIKTLDVVFCCSTEKIVETDIIIKIRGGNILKIPF